MEFWFASDLIEPLGYSRWENFQTAIMRAIEPCETTVTPRRTIFVGSRKWPDWTAGPNEPLRNSIGDHSPPNVTRYVISSECRDKILPRRRKGITFKAPVSEPSDSISPSVRNGLDVHFLLGFGSLVHNTHLSGQINRSSIDPVCILLRIQQR